MTDLTTLLGGDIAQFHFMRPLWLLALIPFVLFYRALVQQDDLAAQWQPVMSKNMVEHLTLNQHRARIVSPNRLFLVFAVLATLIMAGPTWQQQASPFFEDNSELVIALDVSESMNSTDIQPSRLERAKQKINQLVEMRGDAKTGLVVYGGSAHVAMPVTKDRALTRYFLDVLDGSLLPDNESKPASVLKPTLQLLSRSKAPSTVLILTDKTSAEAIENFATEFEQQQHQVIVWAIGENPQSGGNSTEGLSDTQLASLSQLANAGHGKMIRFTHDASDVESVYQGIKNNLFAVSDTALPWLDSGYWLLFLLLPVQLMWFRKGWTLQW
ncbi:VWA domain-containing protein [Motilimonas pumila]|uniref:VWA domain-containing protein n=1 Tax=Motilimonas pumila TaxID=2303987 RepID=A0A418YCC3_9GAMM|nr:VWA domain-containing protein [Motilimonas pumila]RJG42129.1 VWA domain-containing protein [Motilimonas pumila]